MADTRTFYGEQHQDREGLLRSVAEYFLFGAGQSDDDVLDEISEGLTASEAAAEAISGWGLDQPGLEHHGTVDRSHMDLNNYTRADLAAAMQLVMDRVIAE